MTKPTFQPINFPHTDWNEMTTGHVKHLYVQKLPAVRLFINTEMKITTSIGRLKQEELNIIKLDYSC